MSPLAEVLGCEPVAFDQPIAVGDVVMVGKNNPAPKFTVVHICGELAWIKPVTNGQEGLVDVKRLRNVGTNAGR